MRWIRIKDDYINLKKFAFMHIDKKQRIIRLESPDFSVLCGEGEWVTVKLTPEEFDQLVALLESDHSPLEYYNVPI